MRVIMDKYTKDFGNRKEEVTKGSQENSKRGDLRAEGVAGMRFPVTSLLLRSPFLSGPSG